MVEQRPFKALVVGSSPTQPSFYSMAWVYMLRGSCGRYYIGATENFQRRVAEHRRGKVHSTRRFGQPLEVVCTREMPSMDSARELERKLKAKKNPQVAIYLLSKGADQ
jgi:putative endonuclease